MKRQFTVSCLFAVVFLLSACGVEFEGSRLGNDSQLVMSYSVLNKAESQNLNANSVDVINAHIIVDGGSLSVKIQKDGEAPIYENNNISESVDFDVDIEESGVYTVVVIGKSAKGSVDFEVVEKEEENA